MQRLHARRYFFRALQSDPTRAKMALGYIKKLARIERAIADEPRGVRERIRKRKSAPIVDAFERWCDDESPGVLDGTPIQAAFTYASNQRDGLRTFLRDGRLPFTNNASERALRHQAVGRKNWIFVATEDGADWNATIVSLIASAQLHGIEPWEYLRDLLCLAPLWHKDRLLELCPAQWNETREQRDAQELLAGNVFRDVGIHRTPA